MASIEPDRMSYARLRWRWAWLALLALLRRWAIYLSAAVAVLGAFSVGALTSMPAMAGLTVLPLFSAATHGPLTIAMAVLAQAAIATLLAACLRPLLWPRQWSETEQALPLPLRDRLAGDLALVSVALTPLFMCHMAGLLAWLWQSPAWWQPVRALSIGMLVASTVLGVLGGMLVLLWIRWRTWHLPLRVRRQHRVPATIMVELAPVAHHRPTAMHGAPIRAAAPSAMRIRWSSALLALPLARGPAQRSGRWLLLATLACPLPAGAVPLIPGELGWCMAAGSTLALAATTWLMSLMTDELAPLHRDAMHLPVPWGRLARTRKAMAAMPAALWLTASILSMAFVPGTLRPVAVLGYVGSTAVVHWAQTFKPTSDLSWQVSRWLLGLVLVFAFASELQG